MRVAIVDHRNLIREGLAALLRDAALDSRWSGDSLSDFISARPDVDVLIVDCDLEGLVLTAQELRALAAAGVPMLLCGEGDYLTATAAIRAADAAGAVSNAATAAELADAIRVIAGGGSWLSTAFTPPPSADSTKPQLTTQQLHVLRLYASGMKLATVARTLRISPNTVSYHLRMIRQKAQQCGMRVITQRDMLHLAQDLAILPPATIPSARVGGAGAANPRGVGTF